MELRTKRVKERQCERGRKRENQHQKISVPIAHIPQID